MKRVILVFCFLSVFALGLGACGGGGSDSGNRSGGGGSTTTSGGVSGSGS